jgi:hypothetical protein
MSHLLTTSNVEILNRSFRNAPARDMLAFMDGHVPTNLIELMLARAKIDTLPRTNTTGEINPVLDRMKHVQVQDSFSQPVTDHGVYVRECVAQLRPGETITLTVTAMNYRETGKKISSQQITYEFQRLEKTGIIVETKPGSRRWKKV